MAVARDDRTVTDAQGRALAGALIYYCTQPADTSVIPPSPLATVFSDIEGDAGTNPVITDGFGHADAYLDNTVLYTVVVVHPLFGTNPIVWIDQSIGGGGGGAGLTPFFGVPTGTIDGANTVFTMVNGSTPLGAIPTESFVWNNYTLIPGLDYVLSLVSGQVKITFAKPPQPISGSIPADKLYAQGTI